MELWSIYQPIFLCEKREMDHTTSLLPLLSSVLIILKKVLLFMFAAVNLRRTSLTCSSRLTLRPSTNSTEVRHRVIMMIIKVVMLGFFFCILYTCSRVSPESDLIKPSSWTCWYILMCLLQLFLWERFTLWPSAGPYRRRGNTTGESSTASRTCTGAEGG